MVSLEAKAKCCVHDRRGLFEDPTFSAPHPCYVAEVMVSPRRASTRQTRWVLLGSIGMTIVLYVVPCGRLVAWPLVLISTLAHELGHGMAAILVGGTFTSLKIWADGSGLASFAISGSGARQAIVAAGGLVGPAVAAAIFFLTGRTPEAARACLYATGAGLLVAEIFVVRSAFAAVFVAIVIALCWLIGSKGQPWLVQLTVVFIGVQLALSVFSRGDYLFTPIAHTNQGPMPSDTAVIADALFLPYWFWGAVVGVASIAILGWAVLYTVRGSAS